MKKLTLAAAMTLWAGLAAADPVTGIWQTEPDDNGNFGHVQVSPCGETICGVLIRAFDSSGKETPSDRIGQRILWDMVPLSAGSYGEGKIYAPDRDQTYRSKMALDGNALTVEGCVFVVCRGTVWRRVQ
ncbi:MAG: DUF2147 domain-containing protein [Pseudomonadota bacterium]